MFIHCAVAISTAIEQRVYNISIGMPCTDQQFESVLSAITAGKTIAQACELSGVGLAMFQHGIRTGGNERNLAYARAMEQRADILADETITIADDPDKDPNRARNQIQARQWVASKHASKRYGDRIDLNVSQTLDISAILMDARQRLRPVCDQHNMIEAQVLANKALPPSGAHDNESVDHDIFG